MADTSSFRPQKLSLISPVKLSATVFWRDCSVDAPRKYLVSGFDGSHCGCTGGRFNYPDTTGKSPSLYLSGSRTVAAIETEAEFIRLGLPFSVSSKGVAMTGRLQIPATVSGPMLDLTDDSVLRELGILEDDLLVPTSVWKASLRASIPYITHQIGAAARKDGRFGGILFFSCYRDAARAVLSGCGVRNVLIFMNPSDASTPLHPLVKIRPKDNADTLIKIASTKK